MAGEKYYAGISKGYDQLHLEEQAGKTKAILDNASPKGLLLDIGAGTGTATRLFRKNAECIALDPCIEMVKQFSGLKVVAKAEYLPFKKNSFDSVISLTALHHADLGKAMNEINRVAKPKAVVAVSFFKRAKNVGLAKKLFSGFTQVDAGKDLLFLDVHK